MNLSKITQRYLDTFPGEQTLNPQQRQTPGVLFSRVNPANFSNPKNLIFNSKLSIEMGLGTLEKNEISFLVGKDLPANIRTYSTVYAGHQFGSWAGQLGDGRVIFAGEIQDEKGKNWEIQWKGAGATPYSRHADGRAVLRSSIREYLMSEAMFHLGVPSTRALSLTLTGEQVVRDFLYNGNPREEPGAVVMRTSPSFLRFGHFELLSAQENIHLLRKLTDFTIENYFPEIKKNSPEKYFDFFEKVATRTLKLIVEWNRVGFTHGVMNTDNMSIIGETIDYGPFAMLEDFNLNFTSNTTDLPGRRYAFGKQPKMAQWNLWQLANALYPLIEDTDFLEQTLNRFGTDFWKEHDKMIMQKFGIDTAKGKDSEWITQWQSLMTSLKMDYTLFFIQLEKARIEGNASLLIDASYLTDKEIDRNILENFFIRYLKRLNEATISEEQSFKLMRKANPKFVLRNYLLFECIEKIMGGNVSLLEELLQALENPYENIFPHFQQKRPSKYDDIPGCSMLSCSS